MGVNQKVIYTYLVSYCLILLRFEDKTKHLQHHNSQEVLFE